MATALLPPDLPEEQPFHLSADWARCWAEAYGEGDPLVFELGAVRLRMERRRARLGPLRFPLLASPTNLQTCYFDLEGDAPPADALAPLPTRLLGAGATMIRIDWLAEGSPLLVAARGWASGHLALVEPFAVSPLADCRGSFDAWRARAGSSVAKYWKACRRHILDGPLDFRIFTGGAGLSHLLDEIFALEAAGWKGREGTAVLSNPQDAAFYRALAFAAAEAGALRLALLREEGRLIAFEFCVVSAGAVLAMKVGYDERRARIQPGHLVAVMNIRDACADPALAWYDMLGNGTRVAPYKQRFATDFRTLHRVCLFARTPLGLLLYTLYRAKPFAKRLRSLLRSRAADQPRWRKAGTGSLHAKT